MTSEGRRTSWLAERAGVDQVTAWRWVRGHNAPRNATRQQVADALGRTVEDVFGPVVVEDDGEAAA
jgi:transcriptional regulator with XRE-family HTH domain